MDEKRRAEMSDEETWGTHARLARGAREPREMPGGLMWRGNADIHTQDRLFGRTLHKYESTPLSAALPGQGAPFLCQGTQKRKAFPLVSVKFFRSNDGQWENQKKKKLWGESHGGGQSPGFAQALRGWTQFRSSKHIKLSSNFLFFPL